MIPGLRAVLLIAAAALGGGFVHTVSAADCDSRLSVELTPDVPDPRDAGFLSSLLSNDVGYELVFRGKTDDSNIVVELIGPGPEYRCREAIQTMSRDARVLSIHVLQAGVV
jgi:hypothetical protein